MFGGAAPGGESNDEAEAAAKQMGLSLKEYQVAMRMQQNLGVALNAHRSEGGKSGVTVVYDGNVKPVSVALTEEALGRGKEALEKEILEAWGEAVGGAQMAAQGEFQKMQRDVAQEMKGM